MLVKKYNSLSLVSRRYFELDTMTYIKRGMMFSMIVSDCGGKNILIYRLCIFSSFSSYISSLSSLSHLLSLVRFRLLELMAQVIILSKFLLFLS